MPAARGRRGDARGWAVIKRATVMAPDGTKRELGEELLVFPCPCGQEVHVYEHGIIHMMPCCADFNDRSPAAFVRWVRQQKEKRGQQ